MFKYCTCLVNLPGVDAALCEFATTHEANLSFTLWTWPIPEYVALHKTIVWAYWLLLLHYHVVQGHTNLSSCNLFPVKCHVTPNFIYTIQLLAPFFTSQGTTDDIVEAFQRRLRSLVESLVLSHAGRGGQQDSVGDQIHSRSSTTRPTAIFASKNHTNAPIYIGRLDGEWLESKTTLAGWSRPPEACLHPDQIQYLEIQMQKQLHIGRHIS